MRHGLQIVNSPGVIFEDDDSIQSQQESLVLLRNCDVTTMLAVTQHGVGVSITMLLIGAVRSSLPCFA